MEILQTSCKYFLCTVQRVGTAKSLFLENESSAQDGNIDIRKNWKTTIQNVIVCTIGN